VLFPSVPPPRRPDEVRLGRLAHALRTAGRPCAAAVVVLLLASSAPAQTSVPSDGPPPAPKVGQPGKDVIWVPTPAPVVEAMLDMAGVTAADVVYDLGSGDGRMVIAAARRGARAVGVEYDAGLVAASRRAAEAAGVAGRATFVQGDMYAADIAPASVLALYLLPSNLERLAPALLRLRPGTRIVSNTFWIDDWDADARQDIEQGPCDGCSQILLSIVPAPVAGEWRSADGTVLRLTQRFQVAAGTVTTPGVAPAAVTEGRLRGAAFTFVAGGVRYAVRVDGDAMEGTAEGRPFRAVRTR
jgi:SAM-dependent methyltransferase